VIKPRDWGGEKRKGQIARMRVAGGRRVGRGTYYRTCLVVLGPDWPANRLVSLEWIDGGGEVNTMGEKDKVDNA